jgi:hypothetical protein
MHRSGTSLVTRIVNLLGVHLGSDTNLIEANPANAKGFWEHQLIVDLNDDLLRKLGGRPYEPPKLEAGWENASTLEIFEQQAHAIIQSDFSNVRMWGWKDPRTCLTLPF